MAATDAPDDAALSGVVSAWQAAREMDALAKSAALARAYSGRAEEAYQTLASLSQDTRDKPMAEWARHWRSRLETGVTRGDLVAEMRRAAAPDASFKEWTIDKKSVLQKVERGYGLEAAESFIKDAQQGGTAMPASPTDLGMGKRQ